MIENKNISVNKNKKKNKAIWSISPENYFSQKKKLLFTDFINALVRYSNSCADVFPSQKTLAREVGCSVRQIKRFVALGLKIGMVNVYRRAYTSNVYKLHQLFHMIPFRKKLQHLMPSLYFIPLLLLVSLTNGINASKEPNRSTSGPLQLYWSSPLYLKPLTNTNFLFGRYSTRKPSGEMVYGSLEKTEEMMQEEKIIQEQCLFSPIIQVAADYLKLTLAGKCNISAYGELVIGTALKEMKEYNREIAKPYGFFIKLCNRIASELEVVPERTNSYRLAQQLGIDINSSDHVTLEGSRARNPQNKISEARSYSPRIPQQSTSVVGNGSARQTNLPQKEKISHGSTRYSFTIERLQELNPGLNLDHAVFNGPRTIEVHVHDDHAWRETTIDERSVWNEAMKHKLSDEGKRFLERSGITSPPAPLLFKGDPNVYSPKVYYMSRQGILYTHPRARDEADLAERYITSADIV